MVSFCSNIKIEYIYIYWNGQIYHQKNKNKIKFRVRHLGDSSLFPFGPFLFFRQLSVNAINISFLLFIEVQVDMFRIHMLDPAFVFYLS